MTIYPAIDLKDGKCVRLRQGNYNEKTIYGDNPAEMAIRWQECGAEYIHVVDLDGAKGASGYNDSALREILKAVSVPVQLGGGIRSLEHVEDKIRMGISRIIIGTAAVKDRNFISNAVKLYGDKIAVGVDARDGIAAISGWEESGGIGAVELCLDMKKLGVQTIIFTDISKDGMLMGPNIGSIKEVIDKTGLKIIAAGGVSRLEDLDALKDINADGAIIGKALYTGDVDLQTAIKRIYGGEYL